MAMDSARKGEIALLLFKREIAKRGVPLSQNNMRDLGNIAKEINVPLEEMKEFLKPIIQELFDTVFA